MKKGEKPKEKVSGKKREMKDKRIKCMQNRKK
jgi:hypothetical protein